jgi:hypothetical protein
MGLALLVERPTDLATFREALRQDTSVDALETQWERLTFPIESVKRILGSERSEEFERRFDALRSVSDWLDLDVTLDTDGALAELDEADAAVTEATMQWFATGGELPAPLDEATATTALGRQLDAAFPERYRFVLQHVFSPTDAAPWPVALRSSSLPIDDQRTLTEWVLDNDTRAVPQAVDPSVRSRWDRLLTAIDVWQNTDPEELDTLDTWRRRVAQFHETDRVDWTAPLPSPVEPALDAEWSLLFHAATAAATDDAVSAFVTQVSETVGDSRIESALHQYIAEGEFPERTSTRGAKAHQRRAFDDVREQVANETFEQPAYTAFAEGEATPTSSTLTVSGGSNSAGGGSRQYTGRGQQGEVYTIVSVLDRLARWLDTSPTGVMRQFKSRFRGLHDAQQETDYKWHVETAWQNGLLDTLNDSAALTPEDLIEWRTRLDERPLASLPIVKLLNITLEQGPGYDVIDPFGPLDTDLHRELDALQFAPVEVKAVNGQTPPFSFRLTTNEYRRCRAFLSESDHPYIIRLVAVPEAETPDWPAQTEFVGEKVLDRPAELDEMMRSERFERVVKGGYMNMQLE